MQKTKTYGKRYYEIKDASTLNADIQALPKVEILDVDAVDAKTGNRIRAEHFRASVVNGKVIDVPTDEYTHVQHEEAFRPAIEGMAISGVHGFQYCLWNDERRANLSILVGQAADGVNFGFKMTNSFDRTTTVRYSLDANTQEKHVEIVEKEHVLVWGFRQTCSNGMVIKVPLKVCKYMDAVEVTQFKTLMEKHVEIRHKGEVGRKLKNMQYVVEAFIMLNNPVSRMIRDAQAKALTQEDAEELITRYVGKRIVNEVLEQFAREEQTLWGLTNAVTYIGSHSDRNLSMARRDKLLDKAGTMMERELLVEPAAISGGQ